MAVVNTINPYIVNNTDVTLMHEIVYVALADVQQ